MITMNPKYSLLAGVPILGAAFAGGGVAINHPDDRVVVRAARGQDLNALERDVVAQGFDVTERYGDLHSLEVAVPANATATYVSELSALPGVVFAERVMPVHSADFPSDPLYGRQTGYLSLLNAPAAWDIEQGEADVVVAVIDTGVAVQHPDLQRNIWFNPNEVANNGFDDDANGCVDDLNGCSFVSNSSPGCHNVTNGFVNDDIGHGTFVAGIIASAGDGAGMVGVARGVRIMPVKVLDCYGSGDSVSVAHGITYAARNGARVLNLSLGGLEDLDLVRIAVTDVMRDYGAIVVAATGNSGTTGVAFPARIPEVLAVGAAAPNGATRAKFSSYGPEVDVVAVGENIIGTVPPGRCFLFGQCLPDGAYAASQGTSFSTPQVAGLAALMLSLNRSLPAQRIIDIIKSTATPLQAGTTPGWAGSGRINMLAALQAVQADRPAGDACVIESVQDGESFTCAGGRRVRMLQLDAPNPGQCGGDWAKAALANIFLTPGRTVYLQRDVTRVDEFGRELAVPIWRGNDGADYNLAIVMLYVGLARAADVGAGNVAYHDWAFASEAWAAAAQWNMWAPGKTFNGGC